MARVLVTGASGFLGRHACAALLERGVEVRGLGRAGPHPPPSVPMHHADLRDAGALGEAVAAAAPTHVLHLAGIASPAAGDRLGFFAVNALGTEALLEALGALSRPPERVVAASSASVYGNQGEARLHEAMCPAPSDAYGCSKHAMERLALAAAARLPFALQLVRPFNITGQGQSARFLVPKIAGHFRRGADAVTLGNLDVARDFTDARDAARMLAALVLDGSGTQTVNLCSGRLTALRDIVAMCERHAGRPIEVRSDPALVRRSEIPALCGSRERLEAELGPGAAVRAFNETLAWMLDAAA